MFVPSIMKPHRPRPARRRIVAGIAVLAVASAGLAVTPFAAQADWAASSTAIPEGPEGSEVEADRRLTSDIAVARDGTEWFAWVQDAMTNPAPSAQTVLVSKRPAGGAWQPPAVVGTITRTNNTFDTGNDVEIDVDGAGLPTVAWNVLSGTVSPTTATTVQVHARTLGSGGEWGATADFAPDPMTLLPVEAPLSLDVARDGAAALAWQAVDGLHLVRRTEGAWGTKETVDATGATAKVPDTVGAGIDQEGRLALLWRAWDETASAWDVRTRTQNANGGWTGAATTLQEDVAVLARPALAVDGSGAAVATWGTSDGARAAVRPAANGLSAWGSPVTLSSGAPNAVSEPTTSATYRVAGGTGVPSAAFDPHGTATVVWPEVSPTARVALAAVSPAGAWSATETLAEDGTATNPPVAPRVVPGRDGNATAAWTRKVSIPPAGGQVVVSERDGDTGAWGAVGTYVTPSNGAYSTISALGLNNSANLTLVGDALGDALAGWTPYASHAAAGVQQNRVVDRLAERVESLEWTGRGVGGSGNVRSWLNYLRTDWASPGAGCPKGLHGVQVSGAAEMPSATDDASWRFTQSAAHRDATGKRVIQYDGTLRWVLEAHCIDIRISNPRLEIAADGSTARLYADGQTSGSMEEAMAGNPTTHPFTNLRILDISLTGAGPRPGGSTSTWLAAPATLAAGAASTLGLDLYSGSPFGSLTVTAPEQIKLQSQVSIDGPASIVQGNAAVVTVDVPGATGSVALSGAGADQTAQLSNGKATFDLPTSLVVGSYSLTASYAGDGDTTAGSATKSIAVIEAPAVSTTKVVLAAPSYKYGGVTTATVDVTTPTVVPTGQVTVTVAGKQVVATLANGRARVTLPKGLTPGTRPVVASYAARPGVTASTSSATLTVTRATPVVRLSLAKAKIRKSQRAKVTVAVVIPGGSGVHAAGKLVIKDGSRVVATKVLAAGNRGKVTLTLPRLKKGKHRLTAMIGATSLQAVGGSAPRILKVT